MEVRSEEPVNFPSSSSLVSSASRSSGIEAVVTSAMARSYGADMEYHLGVTLEQMPTKYPRIAVTKDEELADALARVEPLFDGTPTASVVHDLAVRGADALLADEQRRREAIQRLIDWSTGPDMDREFLLRVRDTAWR
jgi:hypothetical protein